MYTKQESTAEVQKLKFWKKGILDLSKEVLNVSKYKRHQYNKKNPNGHCGSHQWNQTGNYTHPPDHQTMRFIKVYTKLIPPSDNEKPSAKSA